MNKLKNSLNFSKYIIFLVLILIFIPLIFSREINQPKYEINKFYSIEQNNNFNYIQTKNIFLDIDKNVAGIDIDPNRTNEIKNFSIFLGKGRQLYDDLPEDGGLPISQYRPNNNMFEGETLYWKVLVINLEGIEYLTDVYTTVGHDWGPDNDKWSSCVLPIQPEEDSDLEEYNARFGENKYNSFNSSIMAVYYCYFKAGDKNTLHGEYWITVEAINSAGNIVSMDGNEFWFLNPDLGLITDNNFDFNDLVSGQNYYTNAINIINSPEEGSGVITFLEISGENLQKAEGSDSLCNGMNFFPMENIAYYAEHDGWGRLYNTSLNLNSDSEGFVNVPINETPIIGNFNEIDSLVDYYRANTIGTATLKLRVKIPDNCFGQFSGKIKITGWVPGNPNQRTILEIPINLTIKQKIAPLQVFKCGNTTYWDDATEPGRVSRDGEELIERRDSFVNEGGILYKWKYLFEGEQINWKVLAMDLNGYEKIRDVYVTMGSSRGTGNEIEVNCLPLSEIIDYNSCNLGELRENFTEFNPDIMYYHDCTMTIETADSMYGMYWTTVEAEDNDGHLGILNESEFIFANPVIALTINDSIKFNDLTPGKTVYSNEITIENDADEGSGVVLDMFISGTDFYSSENFSYCPDKYKLGLDRFSYFAQIDNYSTANDLEIGRSSSPRFEQPTRIKDKGGYINIGYGIGFNNPSPFYNGFEIIQDGKDGAYYLGNQIEDGQKMKIKFKLDVPEKCLGTFDNGEIYFWGEAI